MPPIDPDDWFEGDGWQDTWQPVQPGVAEAAPSLHGLAPIKLTANTTGTPSEADPAQRAVAAGRQTFHADYGELEKFAAEHDLIAQDVVKWATGDPDFAERYLATHGKVNFGTYLKIKEFLASKLAAGTAFAERNTQTAAALRGVVAASSTVDEANAAALSVRSV
jgi:hypothetical protein